MYFNHASTGPMSVKVKNALNSYIKMRSEGEIDNYKKLLKFAAESKEMIAGLINSTADRIAFTSNTSSGLNILAQGIRWKKDDRIILNDVEFPANVYPFLNLKELGVEVDFVKSENGIVTADALIDAITENTKLISVSYVQFLSGYRIDLEKLGKVCSEKNIILSVDAIQGLGALTIDVDKCHIDFLSCGTQKWLLGLQGMAFIYVSEELQNEMRTVPVGWLSVENAWDFLDYKLDLKKNANRYQIGTLNSAGVYALHSSLELFRGFGFINIEKTVLENTKYFISEIDKTGFNPLLTGLSNENLSGITSFKSDEADNIFKYLSERNIILAVREGIVRLSPHFYNTKEEIDKVVTELKNY